MKKLMTLLLVVCLLAALAVPATAAKVDLGTMAQDAINELAKYNSTEVGKPFNTKTMMGYVFGTMTKGGKNNQYFDKDMEIRYAWYKIPAVTLESKMLGCFANGQAAITEMTSMEILDYTWEYGGKVADAKLKVYQAGYYYFNDYNLNRTEIIKGSPLKSNTGFVVDNPKTYTVNGYKAAGNYKYDVYATDNTGAVVKFTVEWAGGDIKFVSTAAAASVPGGLTAPGTKADLSTTTTTKAKPTTTTTTKAKPTTTTTTGGNGTTTTTTTQAVVSGGETTTTTTTEAVSGVVTTTTKAADGDVQTDIGQTPDVDTTGEQTTEDNGTMYIIIAVVLGVLVLGIVAAIVIVMVKMKKK